LTKITQLTETSKTDWYVVIHVHRPITFHKLIKNQPTDQTPITTQYTKTKKNVTLVCCCFILQHTKIWVLWNVLLLFSTSDRKRYAEVWICPLLNSQHTNA